MTLPRRKFLSLSIGGAAALALGGSVWNRSQRANDRGVTQQGWALGADVTMTVLGLSEDRAKVALAAAFQELESIEQVMSLYRPDSQISRLNRDLSLRQPHPHLLAVLAHAEEVSRLTSGAFDITVQPLWSLHADRQQQGTLPTEAEIAATRATIDWKAVAASVEEVVLHAPATSITLNGIAQGFAADRALAVLKEHGVELALVNSGEIGARGIKPDGSGWKVGIQHPRSKDAFVEVAELRDRALSTSGDYETSFTPDFSKNHIFDPHTGQSPAEVASVSIAAPTAMQADALSTAAAVLGPKAALELIQSLPNVDALFVLKDGRVVRTPDFPAVA